MTHRMGKMHGVLIYSECVWWMGWEVLYDLISQGREGERTEWLSCGALGEYGAHVSCRLCVGYSRATSDTPPQIARAVSDLACRR
mmetsp:Transcript_38013/g.95243  ORF Transcript_38013/g.95243 Transcript_38013/m.95243 type:complete len:85 (-) Transcript_38013:502-756(-)